MKFKKRSDAIEEAMKEMSVGDNLIIHAPDGRTEFIFELKAIEISKAELDKGEK